MGNSPDWNAGYEACLRDNKLQLAQPPSATIDAVRPVVQWFAQEMERVLKQNDHKSGWQDMSLTEIMARLREESLELAIEVRRNDLNAGAIVKEAVDVANFCMFMADRATPNRQRLALPQPEDVKAGIIKQVTAYYLACIEDNTDGHSGAFGVLEILGADLNDVLAKAQAIEAQHPPPPAPTVAVKEIPTINDVTLQGKAEEQEWQRSE